MTRADVKSFNGVKKKPPFSNFENIFCSVYLSLKETYKKVGVNQKVTSINLTSLGCLRQVILLQPQLPSAIQG